MACIQRATYAFSDPDEFLSARYAQQTFHVSLWHDWIYALMSLPAWRFSMSLPSSLPEIIWTVKCAGKGICLYGDQAGCEARIVAHHTGKDDLSPLDHPHQLGSQPDAFNITTVGLVSLLPRCRISLDMLMAQLGIHRFTVQRIGEGVYGAVSALCCGNEETIRLAVWPFQSGADAENPVPIGLHHRYGSAMQSNYGRSILIFPVRRFLEPNGGNCDPECCQCKLISTTTWDWSAAFIGLAG